MNHPIDILIKENDMIDKYVSECPYCGGIETIETVQSGYGEVSVVGNPFIGTGLYHCICRNCGNVLRSYVKEPEKLVKKKDRK